MYEYMRLIIIIIIFFLPLTYDLNKQNPLMGQAQVCLSTSFQTQDSKLKLVKYDDFGSNGPLWKVTQAQAQKIFIPFL